jgi:hypothetical protein
MISPHISVVIPVYKAEHCLDELYLRLKDALESISPDFEIVLVEDCGGDNSLSDWQRPTREYTASSSAVTLVCTMASPLGWIIAMVTGWC